MVTRAADNPFPVLGGGAGREPGIGETVAIAPLPP
jgi:hypothetical protein